ncbi:hypothetical protein SASPL_112363 [Salvia splendens]|uniref:Anaphase-promoting complex subunit 7 n=1 Tax=Salvia splendens TaxID=180675 RepID=A0A8X9A608_SALSN|nr:hypothetical protein SASPL_112363 [Salvia splendens]
MDVPKDQLHTLLDHGLFSSAQIMVLFGDSLFRGKEFRRVIQVYRQALQYHKILPKQSASTTPTTRSTLAASNRSSSPNSSNTSAINENEVKFKIATCHSSLGDNRAALAEMEGIPSKSRNLEMNLMMAKLYRNSRHTRAAIGCFKECLRNCPYIFEAIIALAELGVSAKDIISLFPQRYVEAQCCIASNDYKGGLDLFAELLQRFPNNIHILLEMAKVCGMRPSSLSMFSVACWSLQKLLPLVTQLTLFVNCTLKVKAVIGKNDEAILDFENVLSIDPYVMTYMDEYAMLLKLKSDNSKLNKLVHDLLNHRSYKTRSFSGLSCSSIRIDERHVAGYIMKGNLFLSLNRPEAAVIAFRGAQELRPDLCSYQGEISSICSKRGNESDASVRKGSETSWGMYMLVMSPEEKRYAYAGWLTRVKLCNLLSAFSK